MKLKRNSQNLVSQALSEIETLSLDDAEALRKRDRALIVDIRDPRELEREGKIDGAFHCPRGLIEFWVDPESPYYNRVFDTDKKIVLYCSLGWRSALTAKTLQDMGLENAAHIEGGFQAWKKAALPISEKH